MTTSFRKSFTRYLRNIKSRLMLGKIYQVIVKVEAASQPGDISNLKKLSGSANAYRIRVGDYRIGVVIERRTVDFVRCLHRRELYRFFP
jgi:mRNA interferase RelE/StbE